MSKFVTLHGFGGSSGSNSSGNNSGELNFDVVAYDSEEALLADIPTENTIGIVTATPITSWAFSVKDPFNTHVNLTVSAKHTINSNSTNITIVDDIDNSIIASQSITGTSSYSVFTDKVIYFTTADGLEGTLTCSVRQSTTPFFIGTVVVDGITVGTVGFGTGNNSSYDWSGSQTVSYMNKDSNVEDGAIWISTSDVSGVSFNALKNNNIEVYPLSASQYINGTWVSMNVKSYQGGEWLDWKRYLFNNGDQCIDLTGGWAKSGMNMDGNHPNNGTVKIEDVISISSTATNATYGTVAAVSTVNPIDLTNVRKIFFKGKLTSNNAGEANSVAGYISTSKNGTWIDGSVVASVYIKSTTTDIVELPVDTYDGKYYVNVASFRNSYGEVCEVWMT